MKIKKIILGLLFTVSTVAMFTSCSNNSEENPVTEPPIITEPLEGQISDVSFDSDDKKLSWSSNKEYTSYKVILNENEYTSPNNYFIVPNDYIDEISVIIKANDEENVEASSSFYILDEEAYLIAANLLFTTQEDKNILKDIIINNRFPASTCYEIATIIKSNGELDYSDIISIVKSVFTKNTSSESITSFALELLEFINNDLYEEYEINSNLAEIKNACIVLVDYLRELSKINEAEIKAMISSFESGNMNYLDLLTKYTNLKNTLSTNVPEDNEIDLFAKIINAFLRTLEKNSSVNYQTSIADTIKGVKYLAKGIIDSFDVDFFTKVANLGAYELDERASIASYLVINQIANKADFLNQTNDFYKAAHYLKKVIDDNNEDINELLGNRLNNEDFDYASTLSYLLDTNSLIEFKKLITDPSLTNDEVLEIIGVFKKIYKIFNDEQISLTKADITTITSLSISKLKPIINLISLALDNNKAQVEAIIIDIFTDLKDEADINLKEYESLALDDPTNEYYLEMINQYQGELDFYSLCLTNSATLVDNISIVAKSFAAIVTNADLFSYDSSYLASYLYSIASGSEALESDLSLSIALFIQALMKNVSNTNEDFKNIYISIKNIALAFSISFDITYSDAYSFFSSLNNVDLKANPNTANTFYLDLLSTIQTLIG